MREYILTNIDGTGIFELPEGVTKPDIKNVKVDGNVLPSSKYAFTDNGNIDIFVYRPKVLVSIEV